MLKRKKIVRILAALLLISLMWVVFLVIQGLFERKVSHHEMFIPENAESVLEVKSEAIIRSFIQDVLAQGELDNQLNKKFNSSDSGESLGVDFLANCYIFTFLKNDNSLTGILLNVLDEEQFKKAMNSSLSAGSGYAVENGVGLMLFESGSNLTSTQTLNSSASEMIQKETKFNFKLLKPSIENAKVNFWKKEYIFNNEQKFGDVRLSFAVDGNELVLKGDATFKSAVKRNYPILAPKALSIQTQFIPDPVNDFWTKNMKVLGFPFPKLAYVSGNYHYSEPSPIKELKVLPNFDGIYGFHEKFNIRIPLIALAATRKISALNPESFKLGGKTIYYKQLDDKTIYLGQSRYDVASNEKNTLLEINGDLKQLLEIRNGGMIERLLKFSPEYNAAERFLKNIDQSDFYINDIGGNKVDLSGEIMFEDGKSALNETTVFLIGLGLFE